MALGLAAGAPMFGDTAPHLSIGKWEQIRTCPKSVFGGSSTQLGQ